MTIQVLQTEGQVQIKEFPSGEVFHVRPVEALTVINGGTVISIDDQWENRRLIGPVPFTEFSDGAGVTMTSHNNALLGIIVSLTPPPAPLTEPQIRTRTFLRC